MGICCSKPDNHPFGRAHEQTSFQCCFPWSNRNIPDYNYDESDDELEFDTILAANTAYSTRTQFGKHPSSIWDKIAALFNQKTSVLVSGSRGYQPILNHDDIGNESDDSIFLNEADAQILSPEQVDHITNIQLSKD
jgi:hypothetical protein